MKISRRKKVVAELLILVVVPILVGALLKLETSNLVIFPWAALMIGRIVMLWKKGEIKFEEDILERKRWRESAMFFGLFTLGVVGTLWVFADLIVIPEWMQGGEVWWFLALHALFQELIFRVYFLNRMKLLMPSYLKISVWGALVFGGAHLVLPEAFDMVILTMISGYVWSLIYLRTPNLPGVWLSHFVINYAFFYL